MSLYPFIRHPENTQFGRGTDEGAYELLNPFKVQQPINNKARRDRSLAAYSFSRNERYDTFQHHFRASSSNPRIHDVFANEIIWRHRDPQPMTFPEGDIRDSGFSALNGLSPLMNLKPIGVAAGSSAGDGMTDFGVTESGQVSMINNSNWDILTGDYVAAIFPTAEYFTNGRNNDTDRRDITALRRMQRREQIQAINPSGLPPEKIMASIVPINRLLKYTAPEDSAFAASMNGMFVLPMFGDANDESSLCVLPTYLRTRFESDPKTFFSLTRSDGTSAAAGELKKYCFPADSDAIRMDIWHNFGIGKALSTARKGGAFQCLLGAPFYLPRHEWTLRDET